LNSVASSELASSFARENCGAIGLRLAEAGSLRDIQVNSMGFPPFVLKARKLSGVRFVDCHFQPMTLEGAKLENCVFERCRFERIEAPSDADVGGAVLRNCEIGS